MRATPVVAPLVALSLITGVAVGAAAIDTTTTPTSATAATTYTWGNVEVVGEIGRAHV